MERMTEILFLFSPMSKADVCQRVYTTPMLSYALLLDIMMIRLVVWGGGLHHETRWISWISILIVSSAPAAAAGGFNDTDQITHLHFLSIYLYICCRCDSCKRERERDNNNQKGEIVIFGWWCVSIRNWLTYSSSFYISRFTRPDCHYRQEFVTTTTHPPLIA